jgi:peroxiredoxin
MEHSCFAVQRLVTLGHIRKTHQEQLTEIDMAVSPPVCDFGAPWHDFTLPGTDGQDHTLAEIKGPRGTLIMFICNHCPYVQSILDRILRDARELQDVGIGVVAISSNDVTDYPQDDPIRMKELAESRGFSFPYLYDETPGYRAGLWRRMHAGLLWLQRGRSAAISRSSGCLGPHDRPIGRASRAVRGHAANCR